MKKYVGYDRTVPVVNFDSKELEGFMYDLVIIDEASQSDILTSLLTMNIARSVAVIGDEKQLSQIDNQNIYDISEKLASIYNIDSSYVNIYSNVSTTSLRSVGMSSFWVQIAIQLSHSVHADAGGFVADLVPYIAICEGSESIFSLLYSSK